MQSVDQRRDGFGHVGNPADICAAAFFAVGELQRGDSIGYRALTRDDFLATSPPDFARDIADRMGAYSCVNVVAAEQPQFFTTPAASGDGLVVSPHRISFRAEMDRSCSWWNDEDVGLPDAYLLQHEQIHFALGELFARDATARVQTLAGRGASPQAANRDFQNRIDELLHAIAAEMRERNTRFDEETSGRYAPEVQERWWRQVTAELEASES